MPSTMISIGIVSLASGLISAALIVVLRPLLVRYALARPNARSSHKIPTPQGGGIAVLASVFLVALPAIFWLASPIGSIEILILGAAALALAIVGAVDDISPLPPVMRLVLQVIAVMAVVAANGEQRVLPEVVPLWLERGVVVLAGVWFINVVNFMDGIDLITVAEVVPTTAVIALLGAAGLIPLWIALIGAALLGGMLGFAPFNRPIAKLFLGDVGSLPIGLLVGWMLLKLAGTGALAAATLLPLYYLADATITLFRRLGRGERVWEAHRQHFYQQAIDRNGFSVTAVVAHVFALNLVLAALALATLLWPAWPVQLGAVIAGCTLVMSILRRFATPRAVQVTA
jgi:UDP-N-acetylmuramyl pentapeptide phosphotransferase/UDP-N-acetylglucosamine-1-phosphate transferase